MLKENLRVYAAEAGELSTDAREAGAAARRATQRDNNERDVLPEEAEFTNCIQVLKEIKAATVALEREITPIGDDPENPNKNAGKPTGDFVQKGTDEIVITRGRE